MSFGTAPFGTAPFGWIEVDFGAPVSFAAALASADLTYVVEVELSAQVSSEPPGGFGWAAFGTAPFGWLDAFWSATDGVEDTLRFSDRPFITAAADTPASTFIDPRLLQPMRLSRGIQLAPTVAADGAQTASIEFDNGDGSLDAAVISSAIDGRPVRVLAGLRTAALSTFETVWLGVARAWEQGEDTVRIEAFDASYLLDGPVQTNRYGGTGTYEGTADLAGTPKPLAMGQVFNVEPVLIDPALLVYQVHDGPVESITVYEGGLAVTTGGDASDLYAGSTTAGQFRTDLARGLFQLGSSPTQRITADVEGDKPDGSTYETGVGTLAYRLLRLRAGLGERYIDVGSFDSLDAAGIGICGLYLDGEETARAVLDRLLGGVAATWTTRRDGRIRAFRLSEPNPGAIVRRLDVVDILTARTLRLPDQMFPPVWRVTVGYRRNYTVQTGEDLSGSVTDERRQQLGMEWQTAQDADGAIRTRHLAASSLGLVESPLQVAADASSLATLLLELHSPDRRLLEITVPSIGQTLEMGDTVLVTWPRLGLAAGRLFRAFPIDEDVAERTVTIALWGPGAVVTEATAPAEEESSGPMLIATHSFVGDLPDHVTYTRTGTASEWAEDGIMVFFDADAPRFAWIGGEAKGLRIEGARTNLVLYSEAMNNAAWDLGGDTGNVTVDQALAPWQVGA